MLLCEGVLTRAPAGSHSELRKRPRHASAGLSLSLSAKSPQPTLAEARFIIVQAAGALWRLLAGGVQLPGHLAALRKYFLLGAGDFWHTFLLQARPQPCLCRTLEPFASCTGVGPPEECRFISSLGFLDLGR